jgi:transposase-like protein
VPKPSSVPLLAASSPPSSEATPTHSSSPPPPPSKRITRPRRVFSPADKLRIVRAADACTERGQVEALLRREGVYSSLLAGWRKQLALHGSEGLGTSKPGRKLTHDPKDARIAQLERHAARLEKRLVLAQKLIELQKKVSDLLALEPSEPVEP